MKYPLCVLAIPTLDSKLLGGREWIILVLCVNVPSICHELLMVMAKTIYAEIQ